MKFRTLIPALLVAAGVLAPRPVSAQILDCNTSSSWVDVSGLDHIVGTYATEAQAVAAANAFGKADLKAAYLDILADHYSCEYCPEFGGFCLGTGQGSGPNVDVSTGKDLVTGEWYLMLQFGQDTFLWLNCEACA